MVEHKAIGHPSVSVEAVLGQDGEVLEAAYVQAAYTERVEMTVTEEKEFNDSQERNRQEGRDFAIKERSKALLRVSAEEKLDDAAQLSIAEREAMGRLTVAEIDALWEPWT